MNANDSTDHGNLVFQNCKCKARFRIDFTTMQTNSKQGAANLVKDAKKNELATVNVAKTGTAHLFKVPTDADRLDLQFIRQQLLMLQELQQIKMVINTIHSLIM